MSSVQGQYSIWDEAAAIVPTSIGSITSALASQQEHWENYNANLAALGERAGDIEGLQEMLASFADGSAESVNAVAGMSQATDEELKKAVENWQDVQRVQKETAGKIAELKEPLGEAYEDLAREMREKIGAMDMSNEAWDASMLTIQGFIDAANDPNTIARVQEAYRQLFTAAAHALNDPNLGSSGVSEASFGNLTPTQILRLERGFASGTSNAPPGVALVGEQGPELVYFSGGERVVNAQQTSTILSAVPASTGSSISIPMNINVHVDGNATENTAEALRGSARELAVEIAELVKEQLEEEAGDLKRRMLI